MASRTRTKTPGRDAPPPPTVRALIAALGDSIEQSAWTYGADFELCELLAALGDAPRAIALTHAQAARPHRRSAMLFNVAAQQARRGEPEAAETAAEAWRALPEGARWRASAWAREAIVRLRAGHADAAAAIDEGLAAASRDTPEDDRGPFGDLVDACLASGEVGRALRIYLDFRRPGDWVDPARYTALAGALLREGRVPELAELVRLTPPGELRQAAPALRLVAEGAAASGDLTLCRTIAASLPPYERSELWSIVVERATPARADMAEAAADAWAQEEHLRARLGAAWLDLGHAARADAILAELLPAGLPWPVRQALPSLLGPLLVRRGRAEEVFAALRADTEAGARLAGGYHVTAHSTLHEWREGLVGAPIWQGIRPGMTDAAHRLGDPGLTDRLFSIALELARAERDPFEAVSFWRDIGAAYHRVGRSADADTALDEARRRAIALRGPRHGLPSRTTALGDLARSEMVLGRLDRALETARKLGRGLPRDTLAQDIATAAAEHADLSAAREAVGLMHNPALAALAVARVGRATLAREGVEFGLGPPSISTRW